MIRMCVSTVAIMAIVAICQVVSDDSGATLPSGTQLSSSNGPVEKHLAVQRMSLMPLAFTENKGQWDERVRFRASTGGATMWFTEDGIYYQFTRRIPREVPSLSNTLHVPHDSFDSELDSIEDLVIKASFVGANQSPEIVGEEMMKYRCNYFIGNDPTEWHRDVPNYRAVRFEEIYTGIDLVYYSDGKQMEYDFIGSPGADLSQIQVHYEGIRSLSIGGVGELVIETDWSRVTEHRPEVFQVDEGVRRRTEGEYVLLADNTFSFSVGQGYDPGLPVIIDPVLNYSTYLGGGNVDNGTCIRVDGNGNAYVTGYTWSTDFPTLDPFQTDESGCDVFVTKLSIDGNGLVYSTYLGGNDDDRGNGLAVDNGGNAYVTGQTTSSDFPTLNPYQTNQGGIDVFVAKLSIDGNGLVYSTYLGGGGTDAAFSMAVDDSGNACITGYTLSTDFPTSDPYQTDQPYDDAFVAKLSNAGSGLIYSTYLGGNGNDYGYGIAVDSSGNAYVTGYTWSIDFPTLNPSQTFQGGTDAFATKLNPHGNGFVYSTFLGGSLYDTGHGITVDGSGNAYVTGTTGSTDFPTLDPFQTDQPGEDAFVTKFSIDGNGLVYSTYLGGDGNDGGRDVAVDGNGNAYITGRTESTDFPTLNPYQTDQGEGDVLVTKLNSHGNAPVYSTYLGGNDHDWGNRIAVDGSGNAYITGYTWSTDFPTVIPYDDSLNGDQDAFASKISGQNYMCGDADSSGDVDIDDVVYLINYIFSGGPPPDPLPAGDSDCSSDVDIDDVVYLIAYIFSGGNAPCDTDGDNVPDC